MPAVSRTKPTRNKNKVLPNPMGCESKQVDRKDVDRKDVDRKDKARVRGQLRAPTDKYLKKMAEMYGIEFDDCKKPCRSWQGLFSGTQDF